MEKNNIIYLVVGVFVGLGVSCLCSGWSVDGTADSKEFDSASNSAKRQYEEHHQAAVELNSKVANYNKQLEVGQSELGDCLREADRHIDNAIKIRTQETQRK